MRSWNVILSLLLACGPGATVPADPASDDACAGLDLMSCIGTRECTVVGGTRFDERQNCRYWSNAIACTSAPTCFEERPFARAPDGHTWMMSDLCIPPDWTRIEGPRGSHRAVVDSPICEDLVDPCADLPEAACHQALGCAPLRGFRLDQAQGCRSAIAFAACTGAPGCSDGAVMHAADPEGQIWMLSNYCLPLGWSELRSEDIPGADAPICGDIPKD